MQCPLVLSALSNLFLCDLALALVLISMAKEASGAQKTLYAEILRAYSSQLSNCSSVLRIGEIVQ